MQEGGRFTTLHCKKFPMRRMLPRIQLVKEPANRLSLGDKSIDYVLNRLSIQAFLGCRARAF
jgi:hypothetical protein